MSSTAPASGDRKSGGAGRSGSPLIEPRKAGVLGSPVAHFRSPQLHLAAYRALGLHDWTYERIECGAEELPAVVGGFGPQWVGVWVTKPGKFAALRFADKHTPRAEQVGSANTLVRTRRGWRADNTDVDGVAGALGAVSGRALVCGDPGGTAPAAVVALAEHGATGITVVARNPDKAARLVDLGTRIGVPTRSAAWTAGGRPGRLTEEVAAAGVLVSTIPADAAARYAGTFAAIPVLLDAVYDPWPTPLAAAVAAGAAG